MKSDVWKLPKYSGDRRLKKLVPTIAYTAAMMSKIRKALHTGNTADEQAAMIF